MPCYRPLGAFRRSTPVSLLNGRNRVVDLPKIVFSVPKGCGTLYVPQQLPCGQCIGCRLERSRQWAMRCVHEASLHEHNCFITLTYSDEWLPYDWSLDVSVFQRFMKRLRNRFGSGIRFYHCGEYGDRFGRPHYHALIFGLDFPDKRLHKVERSGTRLYTSEILSSLWADPDTGLTYGHAIIGDVTFESAAYVARYIMKKINGDMADRHYEFIDPVTGEIFQRKPEYTTMSRRPGIGKNWIDKYMGDVYPRDFVVHKGQKMRPPKYYDRQYEIFCSSEDPLTLVSKSSKVLSKRQIKAKLYLDDNTPDRLSVKERVALARLIQLKRGVDHDT